MKKNSLAMGGTIRLSVPSDDLLKIHEGQLVTVEIEDEELALQLIPGEAKILELTPFFTVHQVAKVEIGNSVGQDGEDAGIDLPFSMEVMLQESESRNVNFTVTPEQAERLAAVLTCYVAAVKSARELASVHLTA